MLALRVQLTKLCSAQGIVDVSCVVERRIRRITNIYTSEYFRFHSEVGTHCGISMLQIYSIPLFRHRKI